MKRRSSILVVGDDEELRARIRDVLESEIDTHVEERRAIEAWDDLDAFDIAAAIIDAGPGEAVPESFEVLPQRLPLLALCSGSPPEWLTEARPEAEFLERSAPLDHVVHALRLSLLRTLSLAARDPADDSTPRRGAPDVATRSVLGDLRDEFRRDLAAVLRLSEELVQTYDNEKTEPSDDSQTVLAPREHAPTTDAAVPRPSGEPPSIELTVEDVRSIRRLADTLDLAEYAPLLFALEVTLRDAKTPDGRSRLRDILRQLRNIIAGRPAAAGLVGSRLRVAHVGADPDECYAFGLEDPDRLDVRPFKDLRGLARQIDLFRPDVVVLRFHDDDDVEDLASLREIRGGTREAVVALTEPGVSFDPIDLLRFPLFAHFEAPFEWNAIAARIFQLKGESSYPSRILVIHDDEDAVAQVRTCLDPESFIVQQISSTADFIAKVHDLGPDCIFLGEELDRLSGFDVCRELRAELPLARIPLVIVSSDGDRALREQAFRVGADDYLELPLIGDEVRRRASLLLEHRQLRFASTARDHLTGLEDACLLIDRLRLILSEAAENGRWTSLLALDIDRFEMIRNFYGTSSADTLVRSVADALRKTFSPEDVIFRGTDNQFFVIRRAGLRSEKERSPIFEGIAGIGRLTFRSPDGRGFYATVTGGHILVPPGHQEVEGCVRRALKVLAAANKTAIGKIMTAEIDPDFDLTDGE